MKPTSWSNSYTWSTVGKQQWIREAASRIETWFFEVDSERATREGKIAQIIDEVQREDAERLAKQISEQSESNSGVEGHADNPNVSPQVEPTGEPFKTKCPTPGCTKGKLYDWSELHERWLEFDCPICGSGLVAGTPEVRKAEKSLGQIAWEAFKIPESDNHWPTVHAHTKEVFQRIAQATANHACRERDKIELENIEWAFAPDPCLPHDTVIGQAIWKKAQQCLAHSIEDYEKTAALKSRVKALEDALGHAKTVFSEYANLHYAKKTREGDQKAYVNEQHANAIELALNPTQKKS